MQCDNYVIVGSHNIIEFIEINKHKRKLQMHTTADGSPYYC